jgi:hypothetical protein
MTGNATDKIIFVAMYFFWKGRKIIVEMNKKTIEQIKNPTIFKKMT